MTIHRANYITIHTSSDEMSALLSISARGSDFPTLAEIEKALSDAGVKEGIDQTALRLISENKDPVHEVVIARGFEGSAGEPDKFVWVLDIADKNRPKINVDGKADFKRLHHFLTVADGDEILTLLPGVPGRPATTVSGTVASEVLKHEPLTIPAGKNTKTSENGLTLYSAISGVATYKDGIVDVDTVYHIHGDVNFSTGNVKYQGTVMIDGDVRSGFRVEATESIYVNGSVEAAEIYSKNGSVVIRDGVLGRNRAKILAGDDLNCGFIQDATASVKNNVIIKHYAINSNITSGGKVVLMENEGLIRGGKTVSEKGIEILVAGSEQNILTEMVLTRSDIGEEQSKLWRAKIRIAEEYQKYDSLTRRLQFLELLRERLSTISHEREKELSKLRGDISVAEAELNKSREAAEELDQESAIQSPEQAVIIRDRIFRKVTVTIGHKKYFSAAREGCLRIYRKGDELIVEPMS